MPARQSEQIVRPAQPPNFEFRFEPDSPSSLIAQIAREALLARKPEMLFEKKRPLYCTAQTTGILVANLNDSVEACLAGRRGECAGFLALALAYANHMADHKDEVLRWMTEKAQKNFGEEHRKMLNSLQEGTGWISPIDHVRCEVQEACRTFSNGHTDHFLWHVHKSMVSLNWIAKYTERHH